MAHAGASSLCLTKATNTQRQKGTMYKTETISKKESGDNVPEVVKGLWMEGCTMAMYVHPCEHCTTKDAAWGLETKRKELLFFSEATGLIRFPLWDFTHWSAGLMDMSLSYYREHDIPLLPRDTLNTILTQTLFDTLINGGR